MQIIYRPESILESPESFILHGCNAQGRMGSGVAKVLFDKYPEVRAEYLRVFKLTRGTQNPFLGTVHYVTTRGSHTVINAITQEFYGYDGALYVSYDAVEKCMTAVNVQMAAVAALTGVTQRVAMPLIGCGLAGGSWPVVSEIIERTSTGFQPVVYLNGMEVPAA